MFDALPDDVLWQVVNHVDNDDVWVVALGSRSLRKAVRRSHPDGLQTRPAGVISSVERCQLALDCGWSHTYGLVNLAIHHHSPHVLKWAIDKGCRHHMTDVFTKAQTY
jgi:hypothetical protein